MSVFHRRIAGMMLSLLGSFSLAAWAQEPPAGPQCGPDEIDMGDYCAQRPPEAAKLKPGARRATPFRMKGMMPGRVGEAETSDPIPGRAGEPETPESSTSGFGVQLGVFSAHATAISVARDAESRVGGRFALVRMPREQRILWACIHGPFPDEASAEDAMRRLRDKTPYKEAFVKFLDHMEPLDLNDASTEE